MVDETTQDTTSAVEATVVEKKLYYGLTKCQVILAGTAAFVALLIFAFGLKGLLAFFLLLLSKSFWPMFYGSVKIFGLAILAVLAPVKTINIWENRSKDNFADAMVALGKVTDEQRAALIAAQQPFHDIVTDKDKFLSREEARQILIDKIKHTFQSIKETASKLIDKIC
ncbi:MAG: hypothetical protein KC877_03070 [Candidatus Kaiserbacteria bacterium]|nr:hypothetical protein [Candidatus Kaiserbacteria bacterium]MCB9816701.1 hypothetical protein [Candidatus Nomurabacteria bacterium]